MWVACAAESGQGPVARAGVTALLRFGRPAVGAGSDWPRQRLVEAGRQLCRAQHHDAVVLAHLARERTRSLACEPLRCCPLLRTSHAEHAEVPGKAPARDRVMRGGIMRLNNHTEEARCGVWSRRGAHRGVDGRRDRAAARLAVQQAEHQAVGEVERELAEAHAGELREALDEDLCVQGSLLGLARCSTAGSSRRAQSHAQTACAHSAHARDR